MFALLYFLMIRPQMKRAKEHKQMTEALQKATRSSPRAGARKITKIGETYVSIEIAPNTEVQMQRSAIQTLLPGHDQVHLDESLPQWVYVTIAVALALGLLYTLPNFSARRRRCRCRRRAPL